MSIIELAANQPADRFYLGGEQIRRFRGDAAAGDRVPEDWVASGTALFGEQHLGLTTLADGSLLRDAFQADPVRWFGEQHAARWGADPALLVKLLDAGQRLPVHAHPDRQWAAEHLGLAHGKAEAWIALSGAEVRLGFVRDVGEDELARWVAEQDVDAMLGAMHRLRVEPGDAVFVPAGLPHAIGEGAFFVELQEPTDLSILIEWEGFALDGARDGHLGLGFGTALTAMDRRGWSADEIAALRSAAGRQGRDLLPAARAFFRAERWTGSARWEPGFAVLVVVRGGARLAPAAGPSVTVRAGQTWVLDHAAGAVDVTGEDVEILRCRPPAT